MTDPTEAIRKALEAGPTAWIACNPAAIRELLDRLDSAERERDELKVQCDKAAARLDKALTVCRCALRVIESPAYQGVSDEDCDLEISTRNWQNSLRSVGEKEPG